MYDVCWSELDEHQLITAGADSLIRLWDIRTRVSENCFSLTCFYGRNYDTMMLDDLDGQ